MTIFHAARHLTMTMMNFRDSTVCRLNDCEISRRLTTDGTRRAGWNAKRLHGTELRCAHHSVDRARV